MKFIPRKIEKQVDGCSYPKCESEAWDGSRGCLMCGSRFCFKHYSAQIKSVGTEFHIQAFDPFSSQPTAPYRVEFCTGCFNTKEAKQLRKLYESANIAIKKAGNAIMPIIRIKVSRRTK